MGARCFIFGQRVILPPGAGMCVCPPISWRWVLTFRNAKGDNLGAPPCPISVQPPEDGGVINYESLLRFLRSQNFKNAWKSRQNYIFRLHVHMMFFFEDSLCEFLRRNFRQKLLKKRSFLHELIRIVQEEESKNAGIQRY